MQVNGRSSAFALAGGVSLSRAALDMALAQAAMGAGACFLAETSASISDESQSSDAYRSVKLHHAAGSRSIDARVVLVADGLQGTSVRQCATLHQQVANGARIGLGAAFYDASADYVPGTIYMGVTRWGYAGLVRTEDGSLNVAAAVDPELLRDCGGPRPAIEHILSAARLPLPVALQQAEWQGTLPLTRARRALATHRTFVLGDAAGYVEPFTGEGIAWAVSSAIAVQDYVRQGVRRWENSLPDQWSRTYMRVVGRRQRICRIVTAGLRHPTAIRRLAQLAARIPMLSQSLARHVSGYSA